MAYTCTDNNACGGGGCGSSGGASCSGGCGGGCGGCDSGCNTGCKGSCKGGCTGTCTDACAQACNNNCSGGCRNSCKGTCGLECKGECNSGCSTSANAELYNSLKAGLDEYITKKDLSDIYTLYTVVKARKDKSNNPTKNLNMDFSLKQYNDILETDIEKLIAIAKGLEYSNNFKDIDIIQYRLFLETVANTLLDVALTGYSKVWPRGSVT